MLSIRLQKYSLCDGFTRRSVLQVGASALCGVSLLQFLRAESDSGQRDPHKGIVIVYTTGGPSHIGMFDLKPSAPIEIRGEFKPIPTNVLGYSNLRAPAAPCIDNG